MSQHFVIVIEADNERAHAAYLNGLVDLERIWPQIETYAAAVDAKSEQEHQLREAERKKREDERKAKMEAYYSRLEVWRSAPSFFRGPMPRCPLIMPELPDWYTPRSMMAHYESIRAELKHMADLAGAALGPYRMTEHQVREMVAWEDGSRIDQIKAQIAKELQP